MSFGIVVSKLAQRVLHGHMPGFELSHDFFPQPDDLIWTPAGRRDRPRPLLEKFVRPSYTRTAAAF